ncbi:hypothetical protein CEXT_267011 [Caerostris extrusa]|uniref:Uncharacterized protein n=1 Tax=Caerostris extrusa TaxID=172846 RepID=A0AAV4V8D3_CAEEX|nr:hypothetical protein CEXT_267011 [Caerostris extrusa]
MCKASELISYYLLLNSFEHISLNEGGHIEHLSSTRHCSVLDTINNFTTCDRLQSQIFQDNRVVIRPTPWPPLLIRFPKIRKTGWTIDSSAGDVITPCPHPFSFNYRAMCLSNSGRILKTLLFSRKIGMLIGGVVVVTGKTRGHE